MLKSVLLKCSYWLNQDVSSKIIFYHDVYDQIQYTNMGTSLELFKKHIEVIENNFFMITSNIDKPFRQLQICFDDGFRGIWDTREYFLHKKIYPTVFLAVDLIGEKNYLNKQEIIELQHLGFKFQSHSWSHRNLTQYGNDKLTHELKDSKNFLSDLLGTEVDEICFPIGFYSDKIYVKCLECGYKRMYTSIPGNYYNDFLAEGLLCRILLQNLSPQMVKYVLNGALNPFKFHYLRKYYMK